MIAVLVAVAFAADDEVSFEAGSVAVRDPAFEAFSEHASLPSLGVRASWAPLERLAVSAAWHRGRREADVTVPVGGLETVFVADEFTLGLRTDVNIRDTLLPYVRADGVLFRGAARLDDDTADRDNPGEVHESGLAPGVQAVGGVELRASYLDLGPIALAVNLEAGYAWIQRVELGGVGSVRPGGPVVQGGVGIRF